MTNRPCLTRPGGGAPCMGWRGRWSVMAFSDAFLKLPFLHTLVSDRFQEDRKNARAFIRSSAKSCKLWRSLAYQCNIHQNPPLPPHISAPNPPEFAQPCLSRVKGRSSPVRGYKFGCVLFLYGQSLRWCEMTPTI